MCWEPQILKCFIFDAMQNDQRKSRNLCMGGYQLADDEIHLQVPPDFYIPDFDEDEQNPDERIDRKLT